MCCLRKRKLFPSRAYFVQNLSAAGELVSMQNDRNRGKRAGGATQDSVQKQANAPKIQIGFFVLAHGYLGEGDVVI